MVALHEVDVATQRGVRAFVGLDTFHQHQAAALVQQRNHLRRDAARVGVHLGANHHAAIELDDLGTHAEHAVEIGMAGTEIVQRHQAAQLAQRNDATIEACIVGQRRFQHLDHHLLGSHPV